MLLYPTLTVRRVTEVTPGLLACHGIRGLILDADNTLTTHGNPVPGPGVLRWLTEMKRRGIGLIIASNNTNKRVRPLAESLGLDYVPMAAKPFTFGLARSAKRLGLTNRQVAVVGDQIFTDILGGNLYGCVTILAEPMLLERGPFFRLKRRLEAGILRRYRSRTKL